MVDLIGDVHIVLVSSSNNAARSRDGALATTFMGSP
jgi:hypothetical protein